MLESNMWTKSLIELQLLLKLRAQNSPSRKASGATPIDPEKTTLKLRLWVKMAELKLVRK